jgi:hypothetical protein
LGREAHEKAQNLYFPVIFPSNSELPGHASSLARRRNV